ncbi:MAG: F0F1 ATP synthase subunit delta [Prevotellaceae bacterium]|jgi:F-type H+-transporting ATPase subunit delta|nr:F0F1 ATP synthase subunit delta [Prevotellaceae bacterium]
MNLGKISGRYAHALYALAEEKSLTEQIFKQFTHLSEIFVQLPQLSAALANPMYSAADKEKLLVTATGAKTDSLLADFFNFVIAKGRAEFMVFMVSSYIDRYRKDKKIVLGKITSAVTLSDDALAKVKQLVSKLYNSDVNLTASTNSELIGGFVLELNNSRYDASVRTELNEIKQQLISA